MIAFVCVRTFPSRAIAEIAKSALQAEGIQSTVSAEDTGYDITLACGGARLLVDAASLDAARAILTTFDADGVDAVAHRGQHQGGTIHVFGIGAVGRVEFGRNCKTTGTQYAF